MARIVLNPVEVHRTARKRGYEAVRSVVTPLRRDAQILAPRGSHRHGSGTAVAGKPLADSFFTRWSETPTSVEAIVGNERDYSDTVARGSRRHKIRPVHKKLLVFEWERGRLLRRARGSRNRSGFFFFKSVMHPGNKRPVRFLQTPLALWGRRANFIVTTASNNRSRLP